MRRARSLLVVLSLALAGGGGVESSAAEKEQPLPVDRSVVLKEQGAVYTVEGRVKIPKNVIVSCQRDAVIRAKGTAPAVILVEGSLEVHGTVNREVIFEGVSIEPQAQFDQVQLEACIFRGASVRTAAGAPCRGPMRLQAVRFDRTPVDIAIGEAAAFELLDSSVGDFTLTGVGSAPGLGAGKVTLRGNTVGRSLVAKNVLDLTVRTNRLSGVTEFTDCGTLMFDGNKVESLEPLFAQTKAASFVKTSIKNCDFYSKKTVFRSPPSDAGDVVVMDKCWFEGKTDKDALAAIVQDNADDPKSGVRVMIRNPQERPLELAGQVNR